MNTLPTSYRVPGQYSYFDLISQAAGFIPVGHKVVLIGQKTSGGTATALVPVQIYDKNTPRTLFGDHSMAYLMSRAFLTAYDKAEVWVLPVSDAGAAQAATKTVTVTASNAEAGTYTLYCGKQKISIAVTASETADEIAAALNAAVNANKENPYTSTVLTNVVTLACANGGTNGNYIKVENTEAPSGVTTVIAVGQAGSGDPDISAVGGVLDTLFPNNFTIVVSPYSDATSILAMKTHVDDISDGDEMRPCLHVFGYTDLIGNQAAFQSLTSTHNFWRSLGFYFPGIRSIYYELAAACAAVMYTQPRPGDPIDDYIVPGIDVPDVADRLLESQKNAVINNGGAPLHVLSEQAAIVMARTTYVSNAGGGYVDKLIDMITPVSLDWLRAQVNNMEANNYKNKKNNAQTRENLEDDVFAILKKAETDEYEITQNVDELRDGIIATPDGTNPDRCNVDIPADIVPGMHQIVNTIRLI